MKRYKGIYITPVIVFIFSFGFLYWKDAYSVVMDWYNDENYSHGFLIPLISGYLLWQRKDNIRTVVINPSNWGLFILFSGLGIYLIGNLSGESFTMRLSMLIVLAGAVIFSSGLSFFKAVSFPFFYLIFMIPLPYLLYDSVAFPLKLLVSRFSVEFLSLIGILVLREGNIIHLAGTTLEVADACSGIRSIISLVALSTAIAYLTQQGWIKKSILIFLAVPIAVFVNAVRVIGTGILADEYGAAVAEGFFHEFAGLLIFGVAIILLILSAIALGKIKKNSL
ncbi:MAG: exosortase [Nitrospirae bacterium]|nr:exosortase [Nitrospirota bacterium]